MRLHKLAAALSVLAFSLWLSVPDAQAFCMGDEDCPSSQQCINSQCRTPSNPPSGPACIPSGGIDDTLYATDCCSGQAVPGSTYCINPADWYTTWASCSHICA